MAKRNGTPNLALREARARGDKFYQPDFLCNNGHMTKRLTSSGACYECHCTTREVNRKKYRENNPEFCIKKNTERAEWAARPENAERLMEYRRKDREKFGIRKKDPEACRADYARIRAKKLGCDGSYTARELKDLIKIQGFQCAECGCGLDKKYEADHKIPLRIGGTNYIWNIQLLCRKCNRAKSCLNPADWEWVKQRTKVLAKS